MADAVRFDAYMDEALYGAEGFYVRGGHPSSQGGDFATSVELGSLFARCVAAYLDRTWREMGQPDPFVVIEGGAGRGTLCRDVLSLVESCGVALRYVLVERVETQRNEALARIAETLDDDAVGVTAVAGLPAGSFTGVVLANELLDNLPIRLLQRSVDGWQEVHVTGRAETGGSSASAAAVTELLQPAPADAAAMAAALAPDAMAGTRVPLQLRSAVWVRRAQRLLDRGRVLMIDYGVPTTAELAARPLGEWLRTYRSQRRAQGPLAAPGSADITCEVAFDQLPAGAKLAAQADWLAQHGIESMTAEARTIWDQTRVNPTSQTLAARALLDEEAALVDPSGFGAFWVAEWRI